MSEAAAAVPLLRAEAAVALADASSVMDALCDHFAEHAEVSRSGGEASFVSPYGRASLVLAGDRLAFAVEGADETSLAFMKMAVAEHLIEFAGRTAPGIVWSGDGTGSTVPPFFREMRVASVRRLTPRMQRLTFRGAELSRFAHGGLHIRLLLPPKGQSRPKWPEIGPDGRLVMPEGRDALVSRIYTIRRIDAAAGEIDVDMVLHAGENMPGAEFAVNARPGDLAGMTGPGGGGIPEAERLLLFGDETALPAIGRILAEVGPRVTGRVVVEVESEEERQDLVSEGAFEVDWLVRRHAPAGVGSLLARSVRETVGAAEADAFVWVAGEFSMFRDVRRYLREELRRSRTDHLAVSYWRHGVTGDGRRKQRRVRSAPARETRGG